MATVVDLLKALSQRQATVITPEIEKNLTHITTICNQKYSDQLFYGNAALNRKMVLDKEIADLLTPEVLTYLFTNTASKWILKRKATKEEIALKDAIFWGFKEGLDVVCMVSNNDLDYGVAAYTQQQLDYANNTRRIVDNIAKSVEGSSIGQEFKLDPTTLLDQYEQIVKTITVLKMQDDAATLIQVPGYTADEIIAQVYKGFTLLTHSMQIHNLENFRLDDLCESYLQNTDALLNGSVLHLLLDRVHIEAALKQDSTFLIGGRLVDFQDIFRVMIQKIATQPGQYPHYAIEQFCLRFTLVERDLQERFGKAYQQAESMSSEHNTSLEKQITETLEMFSNPLEENKKLYYGKRLQRLLIQYQERPFGSSSIDFLNSPPFKQFLTEIAEVEFKFEKSTHKKYELAQLEMNALNLWLPIELYSCAPAHEKVQYLQPVSELIETIKNSGQAKKLLIIPRHLIKNIYLTNDDPLIQLFVAAFPIPPIHVFAGGKIPQMIQVRQSEIERVLTNFLDRNQDKSIQYVTQLQRRFRSRKRQLEEKEDLPSLKVDECKLSLVYENKFEPSLKNKQNYNEYFVAVYQKTLWFYEYENNRFTRLNSHDFNEFLEDLRDFGFFCTLEEKHANSIKKYFNHDYSQFCAKQALSRLKERNKPYIPRYCLRELAQRILEAAKHITLFTTIRHKTSEKYIANILDEGLFSQKYLVGRQVPFVPGAIDELDIQNGDANRISFAANLIHKEVRFTDAFEINLELDKIRSNPCMSFKQSDFAFYSQEMASTKLFNFQLSRHAKDGEEGIYLELFKTGAEMNSSSKGIAWLPNSYFVSSNIIEMQQILLLNFFRLLDRLYDTQGLDLDSIKKEIYLNLGTLSYDDLITQLREIGLGMTRTTEINFYGAYTIDFEAVHSFKSQAYELNLSGFIKDLQSETPGLYQLKRAIQAMPSVFKSQRFIQYLLSPPHAEKYPQTILTHLQSFLHGKTQKPGFFALSELEIKDKPSPEKKRKRFLCS